jgi:hypothetical protein
VGGAVEVGAKGYPFLIDFAQLIEAKDLKASGVGQNGARPGHKAMQAPEFADLLDSGAQVEVVGVAEKNLNPEIFEQVLRNAFHRGQGSDRHENRSFDFAVRRQQAAGARRLGTEFNLKRNRHCRDCKARGTVK